MIVRFVMMARARIFSGFRVPVQMSVLAGKSNETGPGLLARRL
jgi:hypothetical protein